MTRSPKPEPETIAQRLAGLSPTKRALLTQLLRAQPAPSRSSPIPQRDEAVTECPLSYPQQRLWFLQQLSPGSHLYNVHSARRLTEAIDPAALERSVAALVERHEILRTTFPTRDGRPLQVVGPAAPITVPVIDLDALPVAERPAAAAAQAAAEARQPFDLARGPLLRLSLVRLAPTEHLLLLTLHHLICDGWSMGVLFRELDAFYDAALTARPAALAPLPLQYADYALWQRAELDAGRAAAQLAYWERQLAGVPSLDLPTDHPRPAVQSFAGATAAVRCSPALTARLTALARAEGVTLFMVLVAGLQLLLARYSRQEDVAIGTPVAGRTRAELEHLIGCFVNTLVLRTDLTGDPTVRTLLARVRAVTLDAFAHQDVPFEKLLDVLRPARDPSRTPLFQVFINYFPETSGSRDAEAGPVPGTSNFDVTLYAGTQGGALDLRIVYCVALFSHERILELLGQLELLLSQFADDPTARISRLSLVTDAARQVLPDPAAPLGTGWVGAVHELFARWASRRPDRLAVVDPTTSWTYSELDEASNRLATALRWMGVGRESIVAIYGHRSASLALALLGVLKAGAAFTILDPSYPSSRLIECLRLAAPRGWVALDAAGPPPPELRACLVELGLAVSMALPASKDATRAELDRWANDPPAVVAPDDLAAVSFTSGSTGAPKGIAGRHGPLTHFVPWQGLTFDLGENDRYSVLSGLSHDPLQRDLFTPFSLGATAYFPDPERWASPGWLARWMAEHQITIAHLTPAMGHVLADGADVGLCLRCAFFIGDALTRGDVARLRSIAPAVTCVGFYGTTETQRAVGYFVVPERSDSAQVGKERLPSGRGIEDVQLLVLNAAGRLAGIGEAGEIHVRSPHLARGYLGNSAMAALSRERFLTNAFTGIPDDRWYRTGDFGCYLPDGNVEFLGRHDHQVKIRGYRIELAEVQGALEDHPSVDAAVVTLREGPSGDPGLVAYVVCSETEPSSVGEWRRFLRRRLPDYMIPASFVRLDAIPITPNGKVDLLALPAPVKTRDGLGAPYTAPRTQTEQQLASLWATLLEVDAGVHDNFFDLGGHSLLVTQLMSRVHQAFHVELPLRRLFESPTVAGLAAEIDEARARGDLVPMAPIPRQPRERQRIVLNDDGTLELASPIVEPPQPSKPPS